MTWPNIWMQDIFDHKQAFSVWFSGHHLNTGPFDWTSLVFRWLLKWVHGKGSWTDWVMTLFFRVLHLTESRWPNEYDRIMTTTNITYWIWPKLTTTNIIYWMWPKLTPTNLILRPGSSYSPCLIFSCRGAKCPSQCELASQGGGTCPSWPYQLIHLISRWHQNGPILDNIQ